MSELKKITTESDQLEQETMDVPLLKLSTELTELRGESSAGLLTTVGAASSLDSPKHLMDPSTGLPMLTSLFSDLRPITEDSSGISVFYIHIPSSAIVEERFGWEALEAYKGLIANYLVGLTQNMRHERAHCLLARAFADDFVIITCKRDNDNRIPNALADGISRHLSAIDEETAALLKIYVGSASGKTFLKIHPERQLYRMIQQAQTEATDVGRQNISLQVRVLDRCIQSRRFNMLYQPIVKVEDHSIYAYEALVRCDVQELKNPHVLFNVADQGDRIWPLSRVLREMAIKSVPQLPEGTFLFVNLHPQDFDDPQLMKPEPLLAQHASSLVLEVTERTAIHDFDQFRSKLSTLRALGLRIAIDDLGSGYSALSHVAELDPDLIKLDMTLIRGINESPVRQNLIRSMVDFAADLDAQVVAEGVETRQELETLRDLGCNLVQGFYLAMPSPPFVLTIKPEPVS